MLLQCVVFCREEIFSCFLVWELKIKEELLNNFCRVATELGTGKTNVTYCRCMFRGGKRRCTFFFLLFH